MGNVIFFQSSNQQIHEKIEALQLKLNELEEDMKEAPEMQELLVLTGTADIGAGAVSYVPISIPEKYGRYDVRTVYASNITNDNLITVSIGEKADLAYARYISLTKKTVDDILSFPFQDVDNTGFIHMWINNTGTGDICVNYELRILNWA